jgi:AcrR family transcriptional regulator
MTRSGAGARIREAALGLMSRKGITGTTTQEIARRARCSQAALYKSWDGKEALARELFHEAQTGLQRAMEDAAAAGSNPEERILGALLGFLRYARSEPERFAFLFQVFHSDYARWLASLPKPRDVLLRELEARNGGRSGAAHPTVISALLLGMTIRLAFFERQSLIAVDAATAEGSLLRAAQAVLRG